MSTHTPGPLVQFTDKCGCTNTPAFRRCPLHAAAPEMLEALEELTRYHQSTITLDKMERARAAIAKVRGVTPA